MMLKAQTRAVMITALMAMISASATAATSVWFSPQGGVKAETIARLGTATKTIDVAIYSFSDKGILAALLERAGEGVQVRLLLNDATKNATLTAQLEKGGVDVRYVTPILHHKFAVIDGPQAEGDRPEDATLITGSCNWSSSSDSNYDEDFLVFESDKNMVKSFQAEFNKMWAHSRDIEGDASFGETVEVTPPTSPKVVFTSENFEPYESRGQWSWRSGIAPEEGVAGTAIVAAINGAEKSVQIATAHFRRQDIYEALVKAMKKNKITVEIVLDAQEFHGRVPAIGTGNADTYYDEWLAAQGADVRYKKYSRFWDARSAKQMHSKYMVVDGATVLTGSFNWSINAEVKTFENLITLTGKLVAEYEENFAKIQGYRAGELDDQIAAVEATGGNGPCAFDPITLSGKEIEQLHKAYKSGACRGN